MSIGPASIVVPVFGMFIVGGAVLGLIFLHEPLTLRKAIGFYSPMPASTLSPAIRNREQVEA